MTVDELKAKLAKLEGDLTVTVDATDIKLGEMGMNPGSFNVTDAKVGPAFGYGQVAVLSVSVN